ncbi:hypothetical protein MKEN_00593200 [Mycena kentingensis (nom. inval.)]|nr:hypothetical protein MKEN_00593200 [Mycena kentingensis (nom. inval.)]
MPSFASLRRLSTRRSTPTRSPSATPTIPLELHFLILDQLIDDIPTLRSLTLVCLAWASHIQSLLFHRVSVRATTAPRFLSLLSTATHNLGRYVTVLVVRETRGAAPVVLAALSNAAVASRLPNVRALELAYSMLSAAGLHPWRTIRSLTLHFCCFSSPSTMAEFFQAFPKLTRLDVFQCSMTTRDWDSEAAARLLHPTIDWDLEFLAIGAYPQTPLVDWLASPQVSLSVSRLRIYCVGHDASAFNALLAKVGAGLRRLEVPGMRVLRVNARQGAGIPLCLRPCTALARLDISDGTPSQLGGIVLSALGQLRDSGTLTQLSMQMQLKTDYLDAAPWEEIQLAIRDLPHLKSVSLRLWGGASSAWVPRRAGPGTLPPFEEAVTLFGRRMPELEEAGMLRFVDLDEKERIRLRNTELPVVRAEETDLQVGRRSPAMSLLRNSRLGSWFMSKRPQPLGGGIRGSSA